MRYAITGAGLIGRAIAERLAPEHDVVLFDLNDATPPEGASMVVGDIRDPEAVRDLAVGADGIFHTAALHGIHVAGHTEHDFMTINVVGTANVLQAAAAAGVPRVVFSSTAGVIGGGAATTAAPGSEVPRLTDDTPCIPNDIYGESKVLSEVLCDFYRRTTGIEVVALRYGGVRQLVEQMSGHLPMTWAASGMLTDLEDAVESNLLAMFGPVLPRLAYNIVPRTGAITTRLAVESDAAERELGLTYRWTPERFIELAGDTPQGATP